MFTIKICKLVDSQEQKRLHYNVTKRYTVKYPGRKNLGMADMFRWVAVLLM